MILSGFVEGKRVFAAFVAAVVAVTTLSFTPNPNAFGSEPEKLPELEGLHVVGGTLSIKLNDWEGEDIVYGWERDGDFIRVEDTNQPLRTATYTISQADIRSVVTAVVNRVSVSPTATVRLDTAQIESPGNVVGSEPEISGVPVVGETLSVSTGEWSDGVTFSYQWLRDLFPIDGANQNTYLIQQEDAFSQLSVEVVGSKPGLLRQSRVSGLTGIVQSPEIVAGTPVPVGAAIVGCVALRGDPGSWETGVTLEYRWVINDSPVGNFSPDEQVLTLSSENIGDVIGFEVRGSKAGKSTVTVRSGNTPPVSDGDCFTAPQLNPIREPQLTASRDFEANQFSLTPKATVGDALFVSSDWPDGTVLEYEWRESRSGAAGSELIARQMSTPSYVTEESNRVRNVFVRVIARKPGFFEVISDSRRVTVYPELTGQIPTIVGNVAFGETLVVDPGEWSTTDLSYQWLRNGRAIFGETGNSYQVRDDDWLSRLSVVVNGRVTLGTTNTVLMPNLRIESLRTSLLPLATLQQSTPSVSGTRAVGETLTASTGVWTAGTEFSYQWLRNGVEVSGQTGSSFTTTLDDANQNISVRVLGEKRGYSPVSRTSATVRIARPSLEASTPLVVGTPKVGETLVADAQTWTDGVSLTYEWLRNGIVIDGATGPTYLVTIADIGSQLRVLVRGTKDPYNAAARVSLPTINVPQPAVQGGASRIVGQVSIGQTLTAVAESWPDEAVLSYQWFRSGTPISGATAATYVVTQSDIGRSISVRITGSKDGYASAVEVSAETCPVRPIQPGSPAFFANATCAFSSLTPARLMDSRAGFRTVDGDSRFTGSGVLRGGQVVNLRVLGRGGVPSSGVSAVALNVTVTGPSQASHLTVFPSGQSAPNASNLNFVAGQTVPNMVIARVGSNGSVSLRLNAGQAHVIVDVAGWFGEDLGEPEPTKGSDGSSSNGSAPVASASVELAKTEVGGRPAVEIPDSEPWFSGSESEHDVAISWWRCENPVSAVTGFSVDDCDEISHADPSNTYVPEPEDQGTYIVPLVFASNPSGEARLFVESIGPITRVSLASLVQTPNPSVTGDLLVGAVLTAEVGAWDEGVDLTYQWYRDAYWPITEANATTYRLAPEDIGREIQFVVKATKPRHTPALGLYELPGVVVDPDAVPVVPEDQFDSCLQGIDFEVTESRWVPGQGARGDYFVVFYVGCGPASNPSAVTLDGETPPVVTGGPPRIEDDLDVDFSARTPGAVIWIADTADPFVHDSSSRTGEFNWGGTDYELVFEKRPSAVSPPCPSMSSHELEFLQSLGYCLRDPKPDPPVIEGLDLRSNLLENGQEQVFLSPVLDGPEPLVTIEWQVCEAQELTKCSTGAGGNAGFLEKTWQGHPSGSSTAPESTNRGRNITNKARELDLVVKATIVVANETGVALRQVFLNPKP